MFVYLQNCYGNPLMPCQPRKARLLLKQGKAKVVRTVPFTLQLLYGSSGYTQAVSVGIDAGTRHIGVSATTEHTVLFEAEVQPRQEFRSFWQRDSSFVEHVVGERHGTEKCGSRTGRGRRAGLPHPSDTRLTHISRPLDRRIDSCQSSRSRLRGNLIWSFTRQETQQLAPSWNSLL